MREQRYKVGDKVTYKDKKKLGTYNYGGENQKGYVGTIMSYGNFNLAKDCYAIEVTDNHSNGAGYTMLESEFEEWDGPVSPAYKAGDWVVMTSDYNVLRKGQVYQVLRNQMGESSPCWVLDHAGDKSYLAPYEYQFRKAEPIEIPPAIKWDAKPDPYNGFKVGDMVVTSRFEDSIEPAFVSEMVKACGKVGAITELYEHGNVYGVRVHKWLWPVEAVHRPLETVASLKEITDHYMGPEPTPGADVIPPKAWLLAQARSKYSIGTKYYPLTTCGTRYKYRAGDVIAIREPRFLDGCIEVGPGYIYANGIWAELVEPAVSALRFKAYPLTPKDAIPASIHREHRIKRIQL